MAGKDYDVRNVALYLRKSRGMNDEEIDDFKNHRFDLINMCEERKWAYTEYAEIASSQGIDAREKMVELLDDVNNDLYDAVIAVHLDRLSRGDESEQALIKKTLARNEVLFITPQKVYDLNDEMDILMADFEGMSARMEYKNIARRFRQGKARRAKQGFWSNGSPPFPYMYDKESGKAVPNPDHVPVYERMKSMIFDGYTADDIAWELNKEGFPSPRNKLWSGQVIRRIVMDTVHLGWMVVGKKRKLVGANEIVYKPKDQWLTYKNCHDPIKTESEHNRIMFIMQREREIPVAGRAGSNALSGLIRCGKCGHTMQIQRRADRSSDQLKSCKHRDAFGERCTCIGGSMNDITAAVNAMIQHRALELEAQVADGIQEDQLLHMRETARRKLDEIKVLENRLDKWEDMRADGEMSKARYMERTAEANAQVEQLSHDHGVIMEQINHATNMRTEDLLDCFKRTISVLGSDIDPKEMNRAYKRVIHSIIWTRDAFDGNGGLHVNFL